MIAAYILIQTEAGTAAIAAAALRHLPGISQTASLAGPYDVIARAQARDTGELAKLVTSPVQGPRRHDVGDDLPGRPPVRKPVAVDHHTTTHQVGEGGVQAVCSCGWRSPVFGADKTAGTMDPLQRAAEAGDLHEWEMSLR